MQKSVSHCDLYISHCDFYISQCDLQISQCETDFVTAHGNSVANAGNAGTPPVIVDRTAVSVGAPLVTTGRLPQKLDSVARNAATGCAVPAPDIINGTAHFLHFWRHSGMTGEKPTAFRSAFRSFAHFAAPRQAALGKDWRKTCGFSTCFPLVCTIFANNNTGGKPHKT